MPDSCGEAELDVAAKAAKPSWRRPRVGLPGMLRFKAGPIVKGALTFIPGLAQAFPESGGGTGSARYCYGVWLKHLVMLQANGQHTLPATLAELGPGVSLGTGLAALLSGVERYIALDVVPHCDKALSLRVFDELVELLRHRTPRPVKGWPDYDRYLDAWLFPSHILTDDVLAAALDATRVAGLRQALADAACDGAPTDAGPICYVAPWLGETIMKRDSVDAVISHAVLGQVDDLDLAYRAMHGWLKPGGLMSHQIDFEFAGFDGQWNGYWTCPAWLWRIIRGNRPFSINREPCSTHLGTIAGQGFRMLQALKLRNHAGASRAQLAPGWRGLSHDDLECSGLFVVARKH